MTTYKCFICNATVDPTLIRKKIRCPYCGSKILYKQRETTTVVNAR